MANEKLREKVQSWANNCAVYEAQHRAEGRYAEAEYHRGAKESFQRVVEALLAVPAAGEPPAPAEGLLLNSLQTSEAKWVKDGLIPPPVEGKQGEAYVPGGPGTPQTGLWRCPYCNIDLRAEDGIGDDYGNLSHPACLAKVRADAPATGKEERG